MTRKGTDDFLSELALAEPDVAGELQERPAPPPPLPDYAGRYLRAFNTLRNDRSYVSAFRIIGSPQGVPVVVSEIHEMPIPYEARLRYATAHGIDMGRFALFDRLITAMDAEYLKLLAEQRAGGGGRDDEDDG